MSVEDFWLRLYGLSDDLHPLSDVRWNQTMLQLIDEYNKFPIATREALRRHVAITISRLQNLHGGLN
jgi:hypothetical protein